MYGLLMKNKFVFDVRVLQLLSKAVMTAITRPKKY